MPGTQANPIEPGIYQVWMEKADGKEYKVEVRADSRLDALDTAGNKNDGEAVDAFFMEE